MSKFKHSEIEKMFYEGTMEMKEGRNHPYVIYNGFDPDDPTNKLLNNSAIIIGQLLDENKAMREALEFYADADKYADHDPWVKPEKAGYGETWTPDICEDAGQEARKALAAVEGKGEA